MDEEKERHRGGRKWAQAGNREHRNGILTAGLQRCTIITAIFHWMYQLCAKKQKIYKLLQESVRSNVLTFFMLLPKFFLTLNMVCI